MDDALRAALDRDRVVDVTTRGRRTGAPRRIEIWFWRVDGALYAVVEDASEFGPAFAGDEICRAFTEVNGRMVMVTSLSRRNAPPKPGALRAELESVVAALRGANT